MDSTNKWYQYLHKERQLSLAVIQKAELTESPTGWLGIPVFNAEGNLLFSKYRRPPEKKDGAKYTYETGSKTSLYGIERLKSLSEVYITEGELEALTLRTIGREAVSSTGGAQSFQEIWKPLFDGKDVTVLFDNDDAGVNGAVKTALILRKITYQWIPPLYGKDTGDVLQNYGKEKLLELLNDPQYQLKLDLPDLNVKTKVRAYRKELNDLSRTLSDGSVGKRFIGGLVVQLSAMISTHSNKKKFARDENFNSDLERAKAYPIENLLEVHQRAAKCPFHNEKTASFHIYKNNTGFCFGCRKYADPIDIVMVKLNLSFTDAIKHLNKQ